MGIPAGRVGLVAIFGTGRVRVWVSIIEYGTGWVAEMLNPHTSIYTRVTRPVVSFSPVGVVNADPSKISRLLLLNGFV